MKTIVIDKWDGRLTREAFGDINSGLAKFDTSFGYNTFLNNRQLTWFKAPTNVSAIITDSSLVLDGRARFESGTLFTYAISDSGKVWKITGEGGGASLLVTLSSGAPTFTYGGTIEFYNGKIFIGHDKGITRLNFDGTGETQVGTWNTTNYIQSTYRPLQAFAGKLYYGNGTDDGVNVNIGEIDSTNLITSPVKLSPGLPIGTYVRDLDITPDFTYLLITQSSVAPEAIAPVNDTGNTAASDSQLFQWNGTDTGVTVGTSLPGFGATATQSFSGRQMMFMYDTFGGALFEGGSKKWTMRNQKSPFPNATTSSGNFVCWTSPDFYWNQDTQAGSIYGSLYYYGRLDDENEIGLWRLFRQSSAIGGAIYTMPFNQFTTNRFISVNTSGTVQVDSNGTHLVSWVDYSGSAGSTNKRLYVFYAAPPDDSPGSWTGAIAGVYETQTQMFSNKITIKQIRVYCDPTVSNNSFNIDLIGPDGKKIANSSFSYTFVSGTDPTILEGAQDRINFNPPIAPTYGVGVRLTNIGSENMTINKVELDWELAGQ